MPNGGHRLYEIRTYEKGITISFHISPPNISSPLEDILEGDTRRMGNKEMAETRPKTLIANSKKTILGITSNVNAIKVVLTLVVTITDLVVGDRLKKRVVA